MLPRYIAKVQCCTWGLIQSILCQVVICSEWLSLGTLDACTFMGSHLPANFCVYQEGKFSEETLKLFSKSIKMYPWKFLKKRFSKNILWKNCFTSGGSWQKPIRPVLHSWSKEPFLYIGPSRHCSKYKILFISFHAYLCWRLTVIFHRTVP